MTVLRHLPARRPVVRARRTLGRARAAVSSHIHQRIPRRWRRWTTRGLLSIVVPAYNVEQYLAECLDSILAQTYRDLEVIVIVDGATDGTHFLAERYAARDRRVRVHWQPNAGLSAARNAGAAFAHGEFLWFIDSDDAVEKAAAAAAVTSLRATGSDFAVMGYRRFDSTRRWNAMLWIRQAHRVRRAAVSPRDHPDILVNAVAWSKVYRRGFWQQHHFAFPVGARYEDQQVSARAYALAARIDILPQMLYRWRVREDGSSISQQGRRTDDLRARLSAFRAALTELRQHGYDDLASARAVQLLANDLPHSMGFLADAAPEFWADLAAGVTDLAAYLEGAAWREIPAHHAALEWLLQHGDLERAREYVARGGQDATRLTTARHGADLVLAVPFWDDPAVNFPTEVLALSTRQRRLIVVLTHADWQGSGAIALAGVAASTQVAPSDLDAPVTAELVSTGRIPRRIPLPLAHQTIPEADRYLTHRVHDHRAAGFRAVIDIDTLAGQSGTGHPTDEQHTVTYTVVFTAVAAGRADSTPLSRIQLAEAGACLPEGTTPSGIDVRWRRVDVLSMGLQIRRAPGGTNTTAGTGGNSAAGTGNSARAAAGSGRLRAEGQ